MTIEVEEFLEHHGIKGMKWGVRRAASQRNRALNKASRATDKAQNLKNIDAARSRIQSMTNKQFRTKSKAAFQKNKVELGSREARKILQKNRQKRIKDFQTAGTPKNAREFIKALALDSLIAPGAGASRLARTK